MLANPELPDPAGIDLDVEGTLLINILNITTTVLAKKT